MRRLSFLLEARAGLGMPANPDVRTECAECTYCNFRTVGETARNNIKASILVAQLLQHLVTGHNGDYAH